MEIPRYKIEIRTLQYFLILALIALGYFTSGLASFSVSVSHGIITLVVFAAEGIALASVLLLGPRSIPGIFLGQLALALYNDLPWELSIGVSAVNSIEAFVGFHFFRWLKIQAELKTMKDVLRLFAGVFFVLQPLSASLGIAVLWSGGMVENTSLANSWMNWWFGNSLGQVIVAPAILSFFNTGEEKPFAFSRLIKYLLPALATLGASLFVFLGPHFGGISIAFVVMAPLITFIAIRGGMSMATFCVFLASSVFLYYCSLKIGPFFENGQMLIMDLNVFILGITLTSQLVAALFSERIQFERDLSLNQSKLAASAKLAALGEMAAGIAHEVNNPLTIIMGKAEKIRRLTQEPAPNQEVIREESQKIVDTVERIAKIIKGLRLFARSGEHDPFVSENLMEIVNSTLALCNERFKKNEIQLIVSEVPKVQIVCRPVQLSQVLLNLLNNSFDAVKEQNEKHIELSFNMLTSDQIQISVTDSGKKIPEVVASQMMQPFHTTKGPGKGTGLGLSLSLGIAIAHRGTLFYDEKSARTRFVLELPLQQGAGVYVPIHAT